MAVSCARRIDRAYSGDDRDSVPTLEIMGGPRNSPCPDFWIQPAVTFQRLADHWKRDTRVVSSMTAMFRHEAYREIIRMGWVVVPHLLAELEQPDPDHWGAALTEITGEQPVSEEDAGQPDRIAKAWLAWADDRGFRRG